MKASDCADAHLHTDSGLDPSNYIGWHEWANEMSKTHKQHCCPTCGFWAIWLPHGALEKSFRDTVKEFAGKLERVPQEIKDLSGVPSAVTKKDDPMSCLGKICTVQHRNRDCRGGRNATEIAKLRAERDELKARLDHRFIEAAEELAAKVQDIRGSKGRDYIRQLDGGAFGGPIGKLLDELDAAYSRWLKDEPGGRL